MASKPAFPAARLKRLLQEDEEIGRVSKTAPVLISKAIELFLGDIIAQSASCTKSKKRKVITPDDVREAIKQNDKFDFLRPVVADDEASAEKEDEEDDEATST
jgi:histone H3/H4